MNYNETDFLQQVHGRQLILDFDGVMTRLSVDWSSLREELRHLFSIDARSLNEFHLYAVGLKETGRYFEVVKRYETASPSLPPSPLVELLARQNRSFYLYSNNSRATLTAYLDRYHLKSLVTKLNAADDVVYFKPHPEGIKKVIGSADPADFVYIGDKVEDRIAALLAGCHFVHYEYP